MEAQITNINPMDMPVKILQDRLNIIKSLRREMDDNIVSKSLDVSIKNIENAINKLNNT